MASVWKPRGRKNRRGVYKFAYVNEKGKRTSGYGCTDLEATWQIARKLEADAKLRRVGLIDPREEGYVRAEQQPILEHVADWAAILEARKVGEKHARQMRQCVEWIIRTGGLARLSQLGADVVQKTVASLAKVEKATEQLPPGEATQEPAKQRKAKGLATLNRYIVAAKAFSAWLARSKRVREDALKHLPKYNADTDRKLSRRALTVDEVDRLITTAKAGEVVRGMAGDDRAMLYRVAVGTGFRASELASLTPESFNLDSERPTITVEAAYSKRRERDIQPIAQMLARALAHWLADKEPRVRVFAMPSSSNTARMLKVDLKTAGVAYETAEGVADFHSLRHTYITRLAMSNERPKVVQELARHSKLELTMNVYTHLGIHDLQGAVDRMPDQGLKAALATRPTVLRPIGTGGPEVCMRAGRVPVQNGAHHSKGGGGAVEAKSARFAEGDCENPGKAGSGATGNRTPIC
jgi:integrase/recombinase XerD